MTLQIVGYIRVSTSAEVQGISLEAQENQIRSYCAAYGHELIAVIRDEATGSNLNREGLQTALGMLARGEAEAILISKLDRLTRSVRDLSALLEGIFKEKRLISLGENVDTSSPQGRLFLHIMTSVSNWEREVISDRISVALRHIQEVEKRHVGRPPYGFDCEGGNLTRNNEEMKVIRICKDRRQNGATLQEICDELSAKGFLNRTGKKFAPAFVRKLAMAS